MFDKWADQETYVEVWVEKDALVGIIGQAAGKWDVNFFSCRGYTSQSEMWVASQRLLRKLADGKKVQIIHLGDHDPSGIDMSRDILDRLRLFVGDRVPVLRAALNMVQVQKHQPPPNPAKVTDSRYDAYRAKYGEFSWELDALDPTVLTGIVERAILQYCNLEQYQQAKAKENRARNLLRQIPNKWNEVLRVLQAGTNETGTGE